MREEKIDPTHYFNPNGVDSLDETIYGGNPRGFVDFNKSKYHWAKATWDLMNANAWFPSEVDTSEEKKNFKRLVPNEKGVYKTTFGQLSFNDSAQEEHLSDFRRLATNKVVKATISLQEMQEANHSNSYSVLLDACGNSEEVFNLYREEEMLRTKNEKIAEQFARHIAGGSADKMLLSAQASINLEGIYFLLGFGYIYLLGDKVAGARDMVEFIARDELNTHLPLFTNIHKTIRKENKILTSTMDASIAMMEEAVNIELEYGYKLLQKYPIMGVTEQLMEDTVKNYANDRLVKMGLYEIFDKKPETYMQKLVKTHLNFADKKTNFFEGNVKNYAKGSINLDDF